jgi:glycosyltransferase involved in cell wall biosynthesis
MKFIIGMVSRIEQGKGQDTLIDAAAILRGKLSNFEVQIIGEGDKEFLIDLISKYKLEKIVKLLGYKKNLYKIMSRFDVQVFPTRWPMEGFGIVALEAMMLRVPLVASNFGPVPEVVGNAAVVVKPTPNDLANGILKITNNSKLRQVLIRRGEIRVKKYFDIAKIAIKYEKA